MAKREPKAPLEEGGGLYVWDASGRRLLDLASGLAGNLLGHDAPALVRAVAEASRAPLASPPGVQGQSASTLLSLVEAQAGMARAALARGVEEARRGLLALVARYREARQESRDEIIVVGEAPYPLSGHRVHQVAAGDHAGAAARLSARTSALVWAPSLLDSCLSEALDEEREELRAIAGAARALFVIDEGAIPWARGGRPFLWTGPGEPPDLAVVGPGMAAGESFAALLVGRALAAPSVWGGGASLAPPGPLATALALACFEQVSEGERLATALRVGHLLAQRLAALAARGGPLRSATGGGLFHVLRFEGAAADMEERCREQGLLLALAGDDTLLLLPPLALQRGHVGAVAEALAAALIPGGDGRVA